MASAIPTGRTLASRTISGPGRALPVIGALLLLAGTRAGATAPADLARPGIFGREIGIGLPTRSFESADTIEIVALRAGPRIPRLGLASPANGTLPPSGFHRGVAFFAMTHVRTMERPRLARAILGAGTGAGAAGSLNGIGLVSGLWKDRTARYLMGAGTILGAIWGGTLGSDNSMIRIGVDERSQPAP